MAKHKLPPRQKMINLMYLIFIAMLAMNVDREVLRSFGMTNESLEGIAEQSEISNSAFFSGVQSQAKENPEKYRDVLSGAEVLREKSNAFMEYLEGVKEKTGANKLDLASDELNYSALERSEALDAYFFKNGKPTEAAKEFQQKIEEYREYLLSLEELKENDKERVKKLFTTTPVRKKNWLIEKFYEQPAVASLSNISLIEANIRNEESRILSSMLATKTIDEISLNTFEPVIVGPSTIKLGEPAQAKIMLGSYDSSVKGSVESSIGSKELVNGQAIFDVNTGSIGNHEITGKLSYLDGAGQTQSLPFAYKYYVAAEIIEQRLDEVTFGSVVADKMNTVYRGVPNPMTATMSGAQQGSVTLAASTGTLNKKGAGKYDYVPPASGKEVSFTVRGVTPKGKAVTETVKYRVSNLPKPTGTIRGKNVVPLPISSLEKITVDAEITGIPYDIPITVTGFKVKIQGHKTITCSGNKLSADAVSKAKKAQRGEVINIFDIQTKASTQIPEASPVVINVQ